MLEFSRSVLKKISKPMRITAVLLPILCIAFFLTQTIFAKNTYLISDSGRVVIHTTYATDPAQILNEAGVTLGADDTFVTESGLGISEITVQRKQVITVTHGGKELKVISYGETVESLLERLSLLLAAEDTVSVSLNSQTFDGMCITISRTIQAEESYVAAIPFETTYCYDPTLSEGEEKVLTPGVMGQVLRTAMVVYQDGQEVSRTILSENVVLQPINAVIAVGTYMEIPPTDSTPVAPSDKPTPVPKPEITGKPIIKDGVIITPEGEVLTYTHDETFKATAYHNSDPGCSIWTSTGTLCRVGAIAVDPTVIPYGTRMYIVSHDGQYIYGIATAEDCGKSIKGNRIDLYYNSVEECNTFGIRDCQVYFLG